MCSKCVARNYILMRCDLWLIFLPYLQPAGFSLENVHGYKVTSKQTDYRLKSIA